MAKISDPFKGINYKKRAKGQSKREYAAQVLGGKLDYKKNTISVPVKSTSSGRANQSVVPADFTGPLASNQSYGNVYPDNFIGPLQTTDRYESQVKSSKSPSKSSSKSDAVTSQRISAGNALTKSVSNWATPGTPKRVTNPVNTGGTITPGRSKGIFERGLEIVKDPFGIEPKFRGMMLDRPWEGGYQNLINYKPNSVYQEESGAMDAITQLLHGITPEVFASESILGTGENTGVISGQGQPYQDTPQKTPQRTPSNIPAPYVSWDAYDKNTSNSSNRTPSPVSSPTDSSSIISSITGGGISNPYQSVNPQAPPQDYSQSRLDNETIQRLAGKGIFSSGEFANGSGDYGIEGSMGGNALNEEQSLLNQLLGIQTASAQELPKSSIAQNSLGTTLPGYIKPTSQYAQFWPDYGKTAGISAGTGNGESEQPKIQGEPTNQGMGVTGGYTPQQSNEDNLDVQYAQSEQKALKKQQKEQEKAFKKMLKSIEEQYNTERATGTKELDQSKQEQLMKLNSMFSSANAGPGDEQAMQYRQRAEATAADQLAMWLQKLDASRKSQESGAKGNYEDAMGSIKNAKEAAKYKLAKLLAQIQKKKVSYAGGYSGGYGGGTPWDSDVAGING